MFRVSSCSCLCVIYWSQVLNRGWRCSWSSADKRCSIYIWVIDNFIAYKGVLYQRYYGSCCCCCCCNSNGSIRYYSGTGLIHLLGIHINIINNGIRHLWAYTSQIKNIIHEEVQIHHIVLASFCPVSYLYIILSNIEIFHRHSFCRTEGIFVRLFYTQCYGIHIRHYKKREARLPQYACRSTSDTLYVLSWDFWTYLFHWIATKLRIEIGQVVSVWFETNSILHDPLWNVMTWISHMFWTLACWEGYMSIGHIVTRCRYF